VHLDGLHRQLQEEYAERTRWALQLDQERLDAEARIGALQGEFEERTRWALQLNAEALHLRAERERLQHALDWSPRVPGG